MTDAELMRRLQGLARRRGVAFRFDRKRDKGGHGTIHFGDRRTVLGDRGELKTGTLHASLRDLGLRPDDLRR